MDSEKFIPLFLAFLVGVILVGAVFVPVATSSTTRTIEREEVFNEGAEWLKFGYGEGSSLNFGFMPTYSDDTLTIGSQTGIDEDMILYADDESSLISYGENLYFITPDEIYKFDKGTDLSINVQNGSGSVIVHGIPTIQLSPSWAYYPDAEGNNGFFYDGDLNLETGKPTVAVGTYAQAFGYNNHVLDINGVILDMVMSGSPSDSVTWVKDTSSVADEIQEIGPLTPLDPSIIQPIDLDPEPNASIQNVDPVTGVRIGDLFYTFSGNNATVVGYSSSTDFTTLTAIPDTVTYNSVTYSVTSIGTYAFSNCTSLALTSLPDGLTTIGNGAFQNCSNLALTSLPEGLTTIGNGGFTACSNLALTSLPDGVTTIGSSAFARCTNLALTSLPDGLTTIGNSVFDRCTHLALTSLPDGVTTIETGAFQSCTSLALTSLPDGVTSIGDYAFYGCGNLAFTSLPDGITTIGSSAFTNCTNLALTSLPDGITSIKGSSFDGCTNLALTSLPDGITSIAAYSFRNCTNLALTSLPDGLTTIGAGAFYGCTNIDTLIIQSSPTIGANAFNGCTNLKQILNLGDTEITPTSYGLNADSVQDYIEALGYIAPSSFTDTETVMVGGATSVLIQLLPLVAGLGLLLMAVGMMIYRRV